MSASRVVSSAGVTGGSDERILRYSLWERVVHWAAAVTYIYNLITGLAFWSPYMFWAVVIVGGGAAARFWHPWVGLVFAVTLFCQHRMWRRDMATTEADRKWSRVMESYIRNEDEKLPPTGRFNFGQKLFFWAMWYGIIGLLLSGVVMWFNEAIPWSLRGVRYLAVAVHVIAAFVTIGGFIVHVYMSTALVRGSFTAMIGGEASPQWARRHHGLWYDEAVRGGPAKK